MSRRAPNPAADRAAANQSTIKTLLKLEGNKSCADCKRNKRRPTGTTGLLKLRHQAKLSRRSEMGQLEPRYFCLYPVRLPFIVQVPAELSPIRCSGIHRGMGTHISRVKSVDLDAWTDEQLQSVLKWGNTRANKSVYSSSSGDVHAKMFRYWEAKLAVGHVPSEA